MRVGVPREIKEAEQRVAMVPAGVRELVNAGHAVFVEAGAGEAAGFADAEYAAEGAHLVAEQADVFQSAELIVKVKEPQPSEVGLLTPDHVLFGYLHLAADLDLARRLAATGATCIAYETVQDGRGRLPLLAPMSEIAGRLAAHLGLHYLLASEGGNGTLFGGIAGTPPARVVVVGGGVVGEHAASVAVALGARVVVLDLSIERLRELDVRFQGRVQTAFAMDATLDETMAGADLVIGAVLVPGARAPRVVRRRHLGMLGAGAVVIDVSIDQGGCVETSRPTTHAHPTCVVDGVRHAAVTNLPAAAARTATRALTNATLPHMRRLADLGAASAAEADPGLASGINVIDRRIVHPGVLEALNSAAGP